MSYSLQNMNTLIFCAIIVALCLWRYDCKPIDYGPSLQDLESKKCTNHKPLLCIPYGACCSHSEFCHAGLCESCFYDSVLPNLLDWCREIGQHNSSLMRSNSCKYACQDRFTSQELTPINNFSECKAPETDDVVKLQQSTDHSSQDDDLKTVTILALTILLLVIIFLKISCHKRFKRIANYILSRLKIGNSSAHLVSNSTASDSSNSATDNLTQNQNLTRSQTREHVEIDISSSQSVLLTGTSSLCGKSVSDATPPQKRCTDKTGAASAADSTLSGVCNGWTQEDAERSAIDLSENKRPGQTESFARDFAETVLESTDDEEEIDQELEACLIAPQAHLEADGQYIKDVELDKKTKGRENMPELQLLLDKTTSHSEPD